MMNEFNNRRWNLEDLPFDSPQALDTAQSLMETLVLDFEKSREKLSADLPTAEFLNLLHLQENIYDLGARLGAFAYLSYSEDTQNPATLSMQAKIDQLLTGVFNRLMFFSLWFKELSEVDAGKFMAISGDLKYYLESLRRYKPHTLSEAEEKIINIKDLTGSQALVQVYEIVTNSFSFHITVDGEEKVLTRDGLSKYFHNPSPEVRLAAYSELYRVYVENKTVLAQIYAYLVRDLRAEAIDLRSYKSPIAVRNLSNDLPDAVVDMLLEVCRKNTGIFKRYFKFKARKLGMERLRRCDIYAPIARSEKAYEFDTAINLVLDTFYPFSPVVEQAARKVLDRSHLDAEIRPGKRGGAFCYSVTPQLVPWVLTNYTGNLRDVTTLAHELGHAVHAMLASDHSVHTFHAALPLAETASVFAEMLVSDRLLNEEKDPSVKQDLLMTMLDNAYATVQRQAYISIFERQAHDMIAAGKTSDELARSYLTMLDEQFKDAVDVPDEFAWEWISIPHIYQSPFYTYAYSFGQLLVLALYQQYLKDGDAFVPRYLKLLSNGGSAEPGIILSEAGIDIESEEFWQGGYSVLQSRLDQLEENPGGLQ